MNANSECYNLRNKAFQSSNKTKLEQKYLEITTHLIRETYLLKPIAVPFKAKFLLEFNKIDLCKLVTKSSLTS